MVSSHVLLYLTLHLKIAAKGKLLPAMVLSEKLKYCSKNFMEVYIMGDMLRFIGFLLVLACVAGFFYQLGALIFDKVKGNDLNWRRVVWVIVCGGVCVIAGPTTADAFLWVFKTVMDLGYFTVMVAIVYVVVSALHRRR